MRLPFALLMALALALAACGEGGSADLDRPPPAPEERLADWERQPEGTAVPVTLGFEHPLPDSTIAALMAALRRSVPELEMGAPVIYGVEAVGSIADVRALRDEPAVVSWEPGWRGLRDRDPVLLEPLRRALRKPDRHVPDRPTRRNGGPPRTERLYDTRSLPDVPADTFPRRPAHGAPPDRLHFAIFRRRLPTPSASLRAGSGHERAEVHLPHAGPAEDRPAQAGGPQRDRPVVLPRGQDRRGGPERVR